MRSLLAAPNSLFSQGARTRTGPSPYDESEYDYLDRSACAYAAEVRATLDGWFRELPEYARASIRTNFASPETPVHRGALLELYLHETFRRLELLHPDNPRRGDVAAIRESLAGRGPGPRYWIGDRPAA